MSHLRRKDVIQNNVEHLVDHYRNKRTHVSIRCAEIRIIVDFNEPSPKIFVDKEVIAEKLELFLAFLF
jgi:hypothetical protein